MDTVRIETIVSEDGTVVLSELPFQAGAQVEVTVVAKSPTTNGQRGYPLRGCMPYKYDDPFEPLVTDDWEALG